MKSSGSNWYEIRKMDRQGRYWEEIGRAPTWGLLLRRFETLKSHYPTWRLRIVEVKELRP